MEDEYIMEGEYLSSKHLILSQEMMDIRSRVLSGESILCLWPEWCMIIAMTGIVEIEIAIWVIGCTMPAQSRRHHTVKHIKSTLDSEAYRLHITDTHEISRYIDR